MREYNNCVLKMKLLYVFEQMQMAYVIQWEFEQK